MIKFNIYWIYAIIFIFFIGLQFFGTDLTKKTNFKEFNNKMLQQQKVDRITIVNKEKVFIFIKKKIYLRINLKMFTNNHLEIR